MQKLHKFAKLIAITYAKYVKIGQKPIKNLKSNFKNLNWY